MPQRNRVAHDLISAAQEYVDRWMPRKGLYTRPLSRLAALELDLDEEFCRAVGEYFSRAPRISFDTDLRHRYMQFKLETLQQYRAALAAGLRIEPWLGAGQPYRNSAEMHAQVESTRSLYVFLTRDGHGPRPGADRGGRRSAHPMCEPSGVRVRGVEFCHNDLFRAVHDAFGHVMLGSSMGPKGEFRATYCHMNMYSEYMHPVLFTEQISQVCWFFYGPHLADERGRLPRRGEPGWIPPADRPYAEQKVFPSPRRFVDRFKASFSEE